MDQLTAFMMLLSQATHDSRTFISKSRNFFSTSCSSKPDKDKTHSELSLLKSALQSSMVTFSNLLLGLLLILTIFAGTATEGIIGILISVSKSSFFGGGGSRPAASGLSTLAAPLLSSCIACGCMATSTSLQFKEARIILSSFFCNSSALNLLSSSSSTLVISDSMSLISSSMPTSVEASSGIFVGRDVLLLFLLYIYTNNKIANICKATTRCDKTINKSAIAWPGNRLPPIRSRSAPFEVMVGGNLITSTRSEDESRLLRPPPLDDVVVKSICGGFCCELTDVEEIPPPAPLKVLVKAATCEAVKLVGRPAAPTPAPC
ncbi:hypothetical protein GQX74_009824 [Glossina fuscipes]|nr:hypothetical protein GQX74_009824 [Glossina fuscipes]